MPMSTPIKLIPLATAAALALAACGKSEPPSQTFPPASQTAPPPMTPPSQVPPASTAPMPASTAPMPPASSSTAPMPARGSTTASATGIRFRDLALGTHIADDYTVKKAQTTFRPDDHTLYAAVGTDGAGDGDTLGARWTYQDGQTVSDIAQSIRADGPATTTFRVHNPHDWPAGKYHVNILLNGKPVADRNFEVAAR